MKKMYMTIFILMIVLLAACGRNTEKEPLTFENAGVDKVASLTLDMEYDFISENNILKVTATATNNSDKDITIKPYGCSSGPFISISWNGEKVTQDENIKCFAEAEEVLLKAKESIKVEKEFILSESDVEMAKSKNNNPYVMVEANDVSLKLDLHID